MTDPFDLLGLPKRPLISGDEIGSAYRKLAASLHPDQSGGDEDRFKELGEAESVLRDPARRLRRLVNKGSGAAIPPEAADLFPQVATLLREADELLARHATASNHLAKAVLAAPLRKLAADLDTLLAILGNWHSALDARLATLDAAWPAHDPESVATLADSFSYARRWESQLRERKLTVDCLT
jgi:curved DNA-binding protein CbpA